MQLLAAAVLLSIPFVAARAQSAGPGPYEPAGARVAVLDVALYNAQANVREATDSAKADLATEILHSTLARLLPHQLADRTALDAARRSPAAREAAAGHRCDVILACARAVASAVDARWVVLAKVSKTSNLIWLLTAQLVHVPSGTVVLDDSTELKGEPEAMVRAGTRIFAERVARTVLAGGVTTNFPQVSSDGR